MAEVTPPLFMDVSNAYSGDELGLPYRDLIGEGNVTAADFAITLGAGNTINVGAGACWVKGDTNPARQPIYRCINDAVVNRGITPDPANPRRVLIVAQVTDEGFAGSGRKWEILALHGTPAAVPVVPATPASAYPLVNILVPAAAASSAAYTVTSLHTYAKIGEGSALLGGTLAYAEFTSNVPISAATESGDLVVASPAVVIAESKPIVVEFFAASVLPSTASAAEFIVLQLWDSLNGGTETQNGRIAYEYGGTTGETRRSVFAAQRIASPSIGSHVFKIRARRNNANGSVEAGPGGASTAAPGFIRVRSE